MKTCAISRRSSKPERFHVLSPSLTATAEPSAAGRNLFTAKRSQPPADRTQRRTNHESCLLDGYKQSRNAQRAGPHAAEPGAMPLSRSRAPLSVAPTSTCTMGSSPPWRPATSSATSSWASWKRWVPASRTFAAATVSWSRLRSPAVTASSAERRFGPPAINSNPNAHLMEAAYGYSGSGLFGYSPHDGRLCRRPGAVCPGPLRRRRSAETRNRSARTKRSFSCPTSSPPAIWPRRTRRFSLAIPSQSGDADRLDSLPSPAPSCSAPAG